jgi:hypothetical protein
VAPRRLRTSIFAFPSFIASSQKSHHIYVRTLRMDTAQLSLVRQPFGHPDFLFELKHDGCRALAHIWDGKGELVSRQHNTYKHFKSFEATPPSSK